MSKHTPVTDANARAVALVHAARAEGKAKAQLAKEEQAFLKTPVRMDDAGMGL